MNIFINYDTNQNVTATGTKNNIKPSITFSTTPTWYVQFLRDTTGYGNFLPVDLSAVAAWRVAIDSDHNTATDPMCRTIEGITYDSDTNTISCPLNANTDRFLAVANGKPSTAAWFEVWGFDDNGINTVYAKIDIVANMPIDPLSGDPPAGVEQIWADKAYVQAQVTSALAGIGSNYLPISAHDLASNVYIVLAGASTFTFGNNSASIVIDTDFNLFGNLQYNNHDCNTPNGLVVLDNAGQIPTSLYSAGSGGESPWTTIISGGIVTSVTGFAQTVLCGNTLGYYTFSPQYFVRAYISAGSAVSSCYFSAHIALDNDIYNSRMALLANNDNALRLAYQIWNGFYTVWVGNGGGWIIQYDSPNDSSFGMPLPSGDNISIETSIVSSGGTLTISATLNGSVSLVSSYPFSSSLAQTILSDSAVKIGTQEGQFYMSGGIKEILFDAE